MERKLYIFYFNYIIKIKKNLYINFFIFNFLMLILYLNFQKIKFFLFS